MSESILKKEFKESDLQRIRNLVTKDIHKKTRTQVGYKKEIVDRIEGEIWEEEDKKWCIKNGIKMNIGKLDDIKKLIHLPLLCPNCNNSMNSPLDKKFYLYHKKCFNCVIEMEQQLRLNGEWEEYEQKYIKTYTQQILTELEKEFEDFLISNDSFITEQGDVENWGGIGNKDKIRENLQKYIQNIKSKINI